MGLLKNILYGVYGLIRSKAVLDALDVTMKTAKTILCIVTNTEKKKELVIRRLSIMSEEELDMVIKRNHPLGFIGVLLYDHQTKLEKAVEAIRNMNDSEINRVIINS